MKISNDPIGSKTLAPLALHLIATAVSVLIATLASATPAQIATLVGEVRASAACQGVTVDVTCFGMESCDEAIRQKREALLPFESAGIRVPAIFDPWRKVLRLDKAAGEMVLVPYDERASKMRLETPHVAYYLDGDLKCANAIALAVSLAGSQGPHPQVPALIPTVKSSLEAPKGYISYTWANPELFPPRR